MPSYASFQPYGSGPLAPRGSHFPTPGEGGLTDQDIARANALYNTDNPQLAFDTVLRDSGVNPYAANPYVQTLRSTAPGLTNAYMMTLAADPNQRQTWGADFRNYLNDTLSPGAGGNANQGGVYATLSAARDAMPDFLQRMRSFQGDSAANPNATNINPYMANLNQQFATGSGRGALDFYAGLVSPMMNSSLRSAYQNVLPQIWETGQQNFYNQGGNLLNGQDLYHYLLGY